MASGAAVAQIVNPAEVIEPSDDHDSVVLAIIWVFEGPIPLYLMLPIET